MTDEQSLETPNGRPTGSPMHGFRRLLGYSARALAERRGEATLTIDDRHHNSLGVVHGGVYATLLDSAFGNAVAACAIPGRTRIAVTLSLHTTYLAAARAGVLTATSRVLDVQGRVATCAGEVRLDDGTLCATGQASFLYRPGSEAPEGVPMADRYERK